MSTPDDGLDPARAATPAELVLLLETVRRRSGLSYRAVARRATVGGQVLPASTLATMLHRTTLPRRELVAALLSACGVPADRREVWLAQWVRLAEADSGLARRADAVDLPPDEAASAYEAPVPRQLPAGSALFAGRDRDLARIDDAVGSPDSMVIVNIAGAAGVGKTWLALRWAHANLDRYPGGQLHLNLRGFDPTGRPTTPHEAVRAFLPALGVAPAAIPNGLDAQVGLYRSLVAGRRMLILLDNVRDADQVRPLLPGTGGCTVLVTSRHRLASLTVTDAAELLTLDLLGTRDAYLLLARRLGGQRLAAEPQATAEVVERCAGLPLALALVASRAAAKPWLTFSALAEELSDSRDRLDALGDDAPDTDVRTLLSWSYDALSPAAARLFRLLGLHPGPEASLPAAAALAGAPITETRRLLAELTRAHLVGEISPERYTLHDLLRVYAAEKAHLHDGNEERRAAISRCLDHYLHTANVAVRVLHPFRDPLTEVASGVAAEQVDVEPLALEWFRREHHVLVAAIRAAEAGFESHAWGLATATAGFFSREGHWHDWHSIAQAALGAAERADDPLAQGYAHCQLAELYAWIRCHEDTARHLDRAKLLFEGIDDAGGLAYVHLCRGWVHEGCRDYRQAVRDSERALELYTSVGREPGQANALNNIGWYHALLGDYRQAIEYCEQALLRHQKLGDGGWEARTWEALGYAHHNLQRYDHAADCYEHALELVRERGNLYREGLVLNRLGETRAAAGQPEAAQQAWRLAYEVLRRLQHPDASQVRGKLTNGVAQPLLRPGPRAGH